MKRQSTYVERDEEVDSSRDHEVQVSAHLLLIEKNIAGLRQARCEDPHQAGNKHWRVILPEENTAGCKRET